MQFRFPAGLTPGQAGRLEGIGDCRIGDVPVFGCFPELLALRNPGTAIIEGNMNITEAEDTLDTRVTTLYFDLLGGGEGEDAWRWKNQLFYEHYDSLNENSYGFSQFHDSSVIENKLVFSRDWRLDALSAALQLSPSMRRTGFEHAGDHTNEYFDRYDITRSADMVEPRLLATRIDDDYTDYYIGDYTDFGLAALADFVFDNGFSALLGIRADRISLTSGQPLEKLLLPSSANSCAPPGDCVALAAEDEVDTFSWTLSLSQQLANGMLPYVTLSRQTTVIAGQGAEVTTANIRDGTAVDQSSLLEVGAEDLPGIEPWELYGGALVGNVVSDNPRRAGMPEQIHSMLATWDFNNGWTLNGSIVDVEETPSGFSRSVLLPGYTLINVGAGYTARSWRFNVNLKNLTNERYFRANFPNLFGGVIVLPELPRHFTASVRFSF